MLPQVIPCQNGKEAYLQAGPLVLCRPVDAQATTTHSFGLPHLQELTYRAVQPEQPRYILADNAGSLTGTYPRYQIKLWNQDKLQWEWIALQPMAGTLLRQVSFMNGKKL
jgi:hypothetical protein